MWDGGTARQIGLVDQFGGVEEALAYAAKKAGATTWHPVWLGGSDDPFQSVLEQMTGTNADQSESHVGARDIAGLVARQQLRLADRLVADLERLTGGAGAQAYCLECAGFAPVRANAAQQRSGLLALLVRLVG